MRLILRLLCGSCCRFAIPLPLLLSALLCALAWGAPFPAAAALPGAAEPDAAASEVRQGLSDEGLGPALPDAALPDAALPDAALSDAASSDADTAKADEADVPQLAFRELRPGLELGIVELPESRRKGSGDLFVALRIDPRQHTFSLSMASETGFAHSLAGWSLRHDLRAGINASMYLPDKMTSTGFMRSGGAVNNSNLGGRLGAFFVAGPRKKGLPPAAVIDKQRAGWRGMLDHYDIVVQNFRFMDASGKSLWKPGGSGYSMAVVAEDGKGRILFVLSQEALTAERFAAYLRFFDLDLRSVMYVEGGGEAGIFLRLEADEAARAVGRGASLPGAAGFPAGMDTVHVWKGRHSLLPLRGSPDGALPNVIGIRR